MKLVIKLIIIHKWVKTNMLNKTINESKNKMQSVESTYGLVINCK